MPATQQQVRGQGRQLVQGCLQLGRRTFEHATTAQAEQRVPTEKMFSGVKRDMRPGVTGHGYYVERLAQCLNVFTFAYPMRRHRHARIVWRVYRKPRIPALQLGHAADVVVVVVGEKNRLRRPSLLRCGSQNRRCLARVDHDRAAVVGDQGPDVVVRKCG